MKKTNFKEMLRQNNKNNAEEIIKNRIIEDMRILSEKYKSDKKYEEVKQIEDRMEGIERIFKNYDANTDLLGFYSVNLLDKEKPEEEQNKIDEELKNVVQKSCEDICKINIIPETKVQVLDRMYNIKKFLGNYDKYIERLDAIEEQRSKKKENEAKEQNER